MNGNKYCAIEIVGKGRDHNGMDWVHMSMSMMMMMVSSNEKWLSEFFFMVPMWSVYNVMLFVSDGWMNEPNNFPNPFKVYIREIGENKINRKRSLESAHFIFYINENRFREHLKLREKGKKNIYRFEATVKKKIVISIWWMSIWCSFLLADSVLIETNLRSLELMGLKWHACNEHEIDVYVCRYVEKRLCGNFSKTLLQSENIFSTNLHTLPSNRCAHISYSTNGFFQRRIFSHAAL